jgi:hypothetical protein
MLNKLAPEDLLGRDQPRNTNRSGRISTVDHLIEVACLVKKVNDIRNIKSSCSELVWRMYDKSSYQLSQAFHEKTFYLYVSFSIYPPPLK